MNTKNVGVFVDVSMLHNNIRYFYSGKLDYKLYLARIRKEKGNIYRAFAYGSQVEDEAKKFISFLRIIGFEPQYVLADVPKVSVNNAIRVVLQTFNINRNDPIIAQLREMPLREPEPSIFATDRTIDMIADIFRVINRLDVAVIGSSNTAIIPIIHVLQERGVEVLVFSCNIPASMKEASNSWWEINEDLLEDRGIDEDFEEDKSQ
jgi:uncharacterized LabA/DUF88 family protein